MPSWLNELEEKEKEKEKVKALAMKSSALEVARDNIDVISGELQWNGSSKLKVAKAFGTTVSAINQALAEDLEKRAMKSLAFEFEERTMRQNACDKAEKWMRENIKKETHPTLFEETEVHYDTSKYRSWGIKDSGKGSLKTVFSVKWHNVHGKMANEIYVRWKENPVSYIKEKCSYIEKWLQMKPEEIVKLAKEKGIIQ